MLQVPVVTVAAIPATCVEGETIALTASATTPDAAINDLGFVFTWLNTANGVLSGTGNSVLTYTCTTVTASANPHTFTATAVGVTALGVPLTATSLSTDATATATVAVTNAVPVITTATLVPAAKVGETVTLTVVFADESPTDLHTLDVEWGDGDTNSTTMAAATRSFSLTHKYITAPTTSTQFPLTITVTDSALGVATLTPPLQITVAYAVSTSIYNLIMLSSCCKLCNMVGLVTHRSSFIECLLTFVCKL